MTRVRPDWIVFDAADTLLRPEPSVPVMYQRIAQEYGVVADLDEISARFQPAIQRLFADDIASEQRDHERWRRLVFDVLQTNNNSIFDALWAHFAQPSSWRLFPDVELAWTWLTHNGYALAIASNFDARLFQVVSALPPINNAAHVFISSRLGHRKPSLQFFRAIEMELDALGDDLLMIGDSKAADLNGATRAGWQALHLDRSRSKAELPTITTLAALTTILS